MTSPEATLASAAGEVTLYLAFAAPSFLPPRSPGPASRSPWSRPEPAIGPAPDLLCVGRRHARESRSCPRTARASDDQGPHVDRRAGAFAIGGRIRRQGNDPPRLQRGQWLRSHNRWPPCRRGQGAAPIGSSPPRAPRARRAHLPVSVFDACSGGAALSPATAPRPRRCRAWHVAATLRPDSTSNHRGATALEAPSQPKAPGPAFLAP